LLLGLFRCIHIICLYPSSLPVATGAQHNLQKRQTGETKTFPIRKGTMRYIVGFLLLWGLMLPAMLQASPVPKGTRILGLSVGPAEDGDYPRALFEAQAAGVQSVTLPLDWSKMEPAPGKYDNSLLKIADQFYPAHHVSVDLILRPINTNHSEVPSDLQGKPFDDPKLIARFERLLDDVFAQTPHLTLHSLVIGNEVDAYLGGDLTRWKQYTTFYRTVSAYAHAKRPDLKVGVTATFDGLIKTARKPLQRLNTVSDIIAVTYYPLNTSPIQDFAQMCRLFPGRPIALLEAGYPSSPECGSSEIKQATFVRSLFTAWDAHAQQIVSITLSWQTDISPTAVTAATQYYGVAKPPFAGFLGSLGLRTYPGSGHDKPAFIALKEEAHERDW
jgi:hypothetical protein